MRLLMFFSYIGTNYKGVQRLISKNPAVSRAPDFDSVQGILEFGLQKVLWVERLPIHISSRTDTGVHALESTAQFDLKEEDFRKSKRPFSPELICQSLNLFLEKNQTDIRVTRVVQVIPNFNCRRASSRVYEFHVGLLNHSPHNSVNLLRLSSALDIRHLNRLELITPPFDIGAVQQACTLFLGHQNFYTFMKAGGEEVPPEKRWKTIKRFSFTQDVIPEGHYQNLEEFSSLPSNSSLPYDLYTFTVEGSGFLRRQVRRMVGALVGVGKGVIDQREISFMLKNPSQKSWPSYLHAMGPNGLFLRKINYEGLEVLRGYLS